MGGEAGVGEGHGAQGLGAVAQLAGHHAYGAGRPRLGEAVDGLPGARDGGGSGFRQATEMEVPEIVGAEPLVTQLNRFVDLIEGRVDAEEERTSILPSHRIVSRALASSAHATV